MLYRFEIVSRFGSKYEVCCSAIYEEEQLAPIFAFERYAQAHFQSFGKKALGDRLDLHRYSMDDDNPLCSDANIILSATYVLDDGRGIIRFDSGKLIKDANARLR